MTIGVLIGAIILCGGDFPLTDAAPPAESAFFVTAQSLQDSSKVSSPEEASPQKPAQPSQEQLAPEQLIKEVFPTEEFEPRMPQSLAQPGVSRWWQPTDVPAGSWQARDDIDEAMTSWFANLELALVQPHVVSNVNSGSLLSPTFSDSLQLPAAPLGWSVMPSFTVGRISPTAGTGFQLQYRFLLSSGQGGTSTPGVNAINQLQFHVVDLDYLYRAWNDDPVYVFPGNSTFAMGLRFASIYNRFALQPWPGEEAATNSDIGGGVHVGVTRDFPLGQSGWVSVFQADASGVVANNHQTFARNEGLLSAAGSQSNVNGLASANFKGALQYDGQWRGRPFTFQGGYRWERWWFLGATNSNLELTIQGPYLQWESRF